MSTEENKALTRHFYQAFWNEQNWGIVEEVIAADYLDHSLPAGLPPGREGFKLFATVYFTAFPDLQVTVEDVMAEGEKVVVRWTARGTHRGELMGIPPTGKQITVTGTEIIKVTAGKYTERWASYDQLGLLQQIGVIPTMG